MYVCMFVYIYAFIYKLFQGTSITPSFKLVAIIRYAGILLKQCYISLVGCGGDALIFF